MSAVPSIALPPWYLRSGRPFAKTMVSKRDGRIRPRLVPEMSFIWTNNPPPPSAGPGRYSIIHDVYQHSGSAVESSRIPEQGYPILSIEHQFTYPESPQLSSIESLSGTNSALTTPLHPSPHDDVSRISYPPCNCRA